MPWNDYQDKAQIMAALRSMDPVAADAARYLADFLLENREQLGDRETVGAMAFAAMVKALREADLPGGPSNADVVALALEHGQQIGDVALAMAAFVAGKSRKGLIVGAVAVTIGIAFAAIGG